MKLTKENEINIIITIRVILILIAMEFVN